MKTTMGAIFRSLATETPPSVDGYYIRGDRADCSVLKHGVLVEKNLHDFLPYIVLLFKVRDRDLFLVFSCVSIGAEISSTDSLTEIEVTPGLIALFLSEARPMRLASISDATLEEYVFYPLGEVGKYQGHEATDIISYFGKLKVFEIRSDRPKTASDCMLEFLLHSPISGKAITSPEHLRIVSDCLQNAGISSRSAFSRLLWTTDHEQAFVRLYQMLECLYPIPYISSVHALVSTGQHSVLGLLDILTENLDWRYIEIQALERLLKEIAPERFHPLESFPEISDATDPYAKTAKIIYDIRCRIVHRRLGQKPILIDREKWMILYGILLSYVKSLYEKYSIILKESES